MDDDKASRPRVPQPEQWLSEHDPWSTIAIVLGVLLVAVTLGWLL